MTFFLMFWQSQMVPESVSGSIWTCGSFCNSTMDNMKFYMCLPFVWHAFSRVWPTKSKHGWCQLKRQLKSCLPSWLFGCMSKNGPCETITIEPELQQWWTNCFLHDVCIFYRMLFYRARFWDPSRAHMSQKNPHLKGWQTSPHRWMPKV